VVCPVYNSTIIRKLLPVALFWIPIKIIFISGNGDNELVQDYAASPGIQAGFYSMFGMIFVLLLITSGILLALLLLDMIAKYLSGKGKTDTENTLKRYIPEHGSIKRVAIYCIPNRRAPPGYPIIESFLVRNLYISI